MGIVDRFRTGKNLRTLRASQSVSPEALTEAKTALAEMGQSAIHSLFECLAHPEAGDPAKEVLAGLLNDRTLPQFVEQLKSPERKVQQGVIEILRDSRRYDVRILLTYLGQAEMPKAQLESVLAARVDELSPENLITILPDFERDARSVVYRLLESCADASVATHAAALMTHREWWIRQHVAKLLGRIPGPVSEEALASTLGDANRSVRLETVKALANLRSVNAIPSLVKVLRDGDVTVQAAAIDALIKIHDVSAVPFLIDVLQDESEQARRGAVEVLNEVATTEAIKDLVAALRDKDWWVRVRAADALGTIGGERVVEAILGLLDDDDVHLRRYAVEILNQVPDGRSVEHLVRALRDEDWWVRERSIDALASSGDPRAVEPLANLLLEDPQAAPLCARALGTLRATAAIDTLLAALTGDPHDELSREAVEALKIISKGDVAGEQRTRLEEALRQHGIRLEKTKLRPMTVQTAAPHADHSVQFNPLHREEKAPAPGLESRPTPSNPPQVPGASPTSSPAPQPHVRAEDIEPDMVLLGRYRVIRKIGSGGFSTVFLVQDEVIADELILKVLSHHLSEDEKMTQRFVQELKLARRISHKNVIRIHDLLEIGASRAISMEYFPGCDLGELLDRERTLAPARGIQICKQICEGLAAAHDAGVTHRDIKPANVLIGENDIVKIVDFGLASVGREVENRLTRTGHLVGTPHYMAPELIRGEEINAQADLYSFGIMMYEMFSGKLPYDGDNPMNVLFRHLDGDAKPITDIQPGFPEALSLVIAKTMQRDKTARYENAMSLFSALDGLGL